MKIIRVSTLSCILFQQRFDERLGRQITGLVWFQKFLGERLILMRTAATRRETYKTLLIAP